MAERYAKLGKNWLLRGWTDAPMAAVNWVTGDVCQLAKKSFYVAESCDGKTDFDSLAFLPEHNGLLDAMIREGIAETCREGDSIDPWQEYRKASNPRLMGIHWCVTGRCNLNCRHCFMESPAGRYGELPSEDMARLVGQFERANVVQVSLTGGEPFLRRDILDIVAMLAGKRINLNQVYSNGLLITEDHLKTIQRMGFSPTFQISFDGVGAHDQMRGTGGIESSVIEAIRRVRDAGFRVIVATCVDRMNAGRLTDTYDLMKGLGVQSWRIASPREAGNWRGTTTGLCLSEEAEACVPLMDRWLKDGKPFYIQLAGFFGGGRKPKGKAAAHAGAGRDERPEYMPESYDCGSCRERPNLLPDGTLVPCPAYVDSIMPERMPNLLREDLSEVWTGSLLREIASIRKKDLLARNPECAACEMFKECGVGCRASALTQTGDLMAKDPTACELWKGGYKKRFQELADGGAERA